MDKSGKEPAQSCSQETVDIDLEKMKGDAIGDTVYSERYVLKVLMQLSQYEDDKWNEEFESDMCILWDMTATPAVVHFLLKHDSLKMIMAVLESTSNPRLSEMLVGLVGNMCCVEEVRAQFRDSDTLCEQLLQLLTSSDAQTLIQLTRCFTSFTWDLLKSDSTLASERHWFEERIVNGLIPTRLAFILESSLSEELLMAVLDLLNTLCSLEVNDKDYSRYFATSEMIGSMMECWNQLFLSCKEGSKFEFTNKQLESSAVHWVSVLLSFAGQERGRELLGQKAKQLAGNLLHWIQQPEDCEALLIATISLLEALVSFYFCQEAFCKITRIVRKSAERKAVLEQQGKQAEEDMTVLSLKESYGNYCIEVLKSVDRRTLDSVLISSCNEKSIKFFWQIVQEREPETIVVNDRSR